MIYSKKEIKALKIRLALEGTGAKGRMAEELGCAKCQITKLLNTGFIPDKYVKKIGRYV